MSRTVAALLVLSACCLQANAFSSIVAFGDSLTDDCTMGVSQVVDDALNTDQVRECNFFIRVLKLAGAGR